MERKRVFYISSMHFFLDTYMGFFAIYLVIARLDPTKAAIIATATSFIGNLIQPFMGYAADRMRGKLPIFLGMLITSVSMSLLGVTTEYVLIFILVLLGHLGSSFFHPAGANISGAAGHSSRDRSFAVFVFFGTLGFSFSQPTFSWFTGFFGTRNSPYLAIPTLVIALVYLLFSSIEVHGPEERTQLRELKSLLFKRAAPLLLLFFIMVFRSSFVLTMSTFLAKTYEQWGASRALYSIATPVFLLTGAFGILVCGHLTHLIKPRKLLVITQTAFLPFFILFVISGRSGQLLQSLLFLGVCGFLVTGGHGANIVMGHRIAPEMTSTISGILMGFAWALSSYGPTLCAYTADFIPALPGMASGLLVLSVFPVFAASLSLFLPPDVDR